MDPPARLPYSVELYRSRPILVRHKSERNWILWLLELGPDEFLWYYPWYGIKSFMTMSFGYRHVYLLGISLSTFYQATRVLRQMGHSQGIPPDGAVFSSTPITAEVKKAVTNGWGRSFHSIAPEGRSDVLDGYQDWLMAAVWARERNRRVALIKKIESDSTESA